MKSRLLRVSQGTTLMLLLCVGASGYPIGLLNYAHRGQNGSQTRDDLLNQANDLDSQARQLYKAGKYQDALPLVKKVLELRELALGPNEDLIGTSAANVAMLYKGLNDYDDARLYFQRALEIVEKIYGPDHYRVGVCLFEIAQIDIK